MKREKEEEAQRGTEERGRERGGEEEERREI